MFFFISINNVYKHSKKRREVGCCCFKCKSMSKWKKEGNWMRKQNTSQWRQCIYRERGENNWTIIIQPNCANVTKCVWSKFGNCYENSNSKIKARKLFMKQDFLLSIPKNRNESNFKNCIQWIIHTMHNSEWWLVHFKLKSFNIIFNFNSLD